MRSPSGIPALHTPRKLVPASAQGIAVGGIVPFSSVDWPGQLAAVVFIAGCPWRCHYCHNPHLQVRGGAQSWSGILDLLAQRRGLLDGVVFSGGEPLVEPQLPRLIDGVRALGFKVALHTAGIYPQRLASVLPQLDWIGLDIKTSPAAYDALTGRKNSHHAAHLSLETVLQSGCDFECRTTWDPRWLGESELLHLADDLARRGVRHYAVQAFRDLAGKAGPRSLSDSARQWLGTRFEHFSYRQDS